MKQNARWLIAIVVGGACLSLLLDRSDAGPDKGPWLPVLSKENYQEVSKREADLVRDQLNGTPNDAAIHRAKFGAVFLAALTMSVKGGVAAEDLRATRETALALASTLNKKGQLAAAKALAALLPKGKADANAKAALDWGRYVQTAEIMDPFRVKSKGGDGMHPDLQSNIRLKGALNGIEEKVHALGTKELTAAAVRKEAKELELLGDRCAVVGELTYYQAPAKKVGKKDPQQWRTLALQMRDNSIGLAVAAQKGDAAGIAKACSALDSTCTQCHSVFK